MFFGATILHLPAVHLLLAQGLSASHAKPSSSGIGPQPTPGVHWPSEHSLLSALQSVGRPLPQLPSGAHVSPVVQGSPSSQAFPEVPGTISQTFCASLQDQTWHASSVGLGGAPPAPPVPLALLLPPPAPPPPAPAPSPAQIPLVNQIVDLLGGDHATAQQVVAQLDTNPLTTFTTLVLQEEQKQANGQPAGDNVVATLTCKP